MMLNNKQEIVKKTLPKHIGVIMDGNARWAKKHKVSKQVGYSKGIESAEKLIMRCKELEIKYVTLYAFSMENWLRPEFEVKEIMNVLREFLARDVKKLVENDVQVTFIGDLTRLDQDIQQQMQDVEKSSRAGSIEVRFAISYGGRDHLRRAARDFACYVAENSLNIEQVELDKFDEFIKWDSFPDPDLIIRTSGEKRLSNFMPWESTYSELYFADVLWPDFDRYEIDKALIDFAQRDRRYGKR